MSCNHNKIVNKEVSQNYFGLTFSTNMYVCEECNSYLWTDDSKAILNDWLVEQKRSHRDHFVIQAHLSNNVKECLDEMLKAYPGVHISGLIRAMTLVFLDFMKEPKCADLFELVSESDIYESFLHGDKHSTKVQFAPSGMMDIDSWTKILQMRPAKIVEEAVCRMTSLNVDHNPELKKFWETKILPQISLILKSAA